MKLKFLLPAYGAVIKYDVVVRMKLINTCKTLRKCLT